MMVTRPVYEPVSLPCDCIALWREFPPKHVTVACSRHIKHRHLVTLSADVSNETLSGFRVDCLCLEMLKKVCDQV